MRLIGAFIITLISAVIVFTSFELSCVSAIFIFVLTTLKFGLKGH